jgi:hypothetical protein
MKMKFKTSKDQISGTSITSELVMSKNEDSITGDFKSQLLPLGDLKVGLILFYSKFLYQMCS